MMIIDALASNFFPKYLYNGYIGINSVKLLIRISHMNGRMKSNYS